MGPALRALKVAGPWDRLHRAEPDILAGLLTAAERDAVRRRLGLGPVEAPLWVPDTAGAGGRFAGPLGPGALYLGNDLETCVQEVIHHHALHCLASLGTPQGTRAVLQHRVFQVDGTLADASGDRKGNLHHPSDYAPSWAFGARVRASNLAGVHYRSVRREGGRCLAVFDARAAVFQRADFGAVVLEWDGAASRRIA